MSSASIASTTTGSVTGTRALHIGSHGAARRTITPLGAGPGLRLRGAFCAVAASTIAGL